MRTADIKRVTAETDILLKLDIDGTGKADISTGCGFMNHMLELFTRHGSFDISISCNGDTDVDAHHSVEDCGICLGRAFATALGDKRGIHRYGDIILPMDETLVLCAVDISGRSFLSFDVQVSCPRLGDFDTELVYEFFTAFVREAGITLHIKQLDGKNLHHIFEACFKAFGRAFAFACSPDEKHPGAIPSTKGVL